MAERAAGPAPAFRGMVRASVATALAYRGRVAIWILTSLFPLIMMVVWLNVVDEQGPAGGFGREEFISYYVAAALVFQVTQSFLTWIWDDDLRSGAMSFRLLKPISVYQQSLAQDLGMRLVTLAVLLPVVVAAALVAADVRYPIGPADAVLVAVALVLAFLLSCTMSMAFALVGFWTTQSGNLYSLWWGAGAFLSGWVAPLAVLPAPLRVAAELLPFRSTVGFPLEVLLGRLDGGDIAKGFAVTMVWLAAFGMVYRVGWPAAVRRYQAVGG